MSKSLEQQKNLVVSSIENGTVIDHIPSNKMFQIIDILNLKDQTEKVVMSFNLPSERLGKKALIKVEGKKLNAEEIHKLSIVSPGITVSFIVNYSVEKKIKLELPSSVENLLFCKFPACISINEYVKHKFYISKKEDSKKTLVAKCHYCESVFEENQFHLLFRKS